MIKKARGVIQTTMTAGIILACIQCLDRSKTFMHADLAVRLLACALLGGAIGASVASVMYLAYKKRDEEVASLSFWKYLWHTEKGNAGRRVAAAVLAAVGVTVLNEFAFFTRVHFAFQVLIAALLSLTAALAVEYAAGGTGKTAPAANHAKEDL